MYGVILDFYLKNLISKEILVYLENIKLLKYIDVLVDGKFIYSKKDISLKFRGSSNQRIIDVKCSLERN